MRAILALLALLITAIPPGAAWTEPAAPVLAAEAGGRAAKTRLAVFGEVWRLTAERFYDPGLRGLDWAGARARYAPRAAAARDDRELAAVINEMLGELGSSHTHYYTDRDPEYYFLSAVFRDSLRQPIPEWADAGLVAVRLPGGTFVRDVLEGGPAAAAGLRAGDRIVEPDAPFDPVGAFEGKAGRPVQLVIQSEPGGQPRTVSVTPRRISAQRAYLEATQASARRLPLPGPPSAHPPAPAGTRPVPGEAGYVRLWALSHPLFLRALEEALGKLEGTAGLVLDLRGGFGGQSEDYLDLFLRRGAGRIETIDRRGRRRPFTVSWDGPLVVLVDEATRSAKELLAYSLQRAGRARLVGTRTAGAVLASRAFRITDRSLLLLPVTDLLADGRRLEGVGVEPDVVVESPLPYRNGADPQLERALEELAALTPTRQSAAEASAAARAP